MILLPKYIIFDYVQSQLFNQHPIVDVNEFRLTKCCADRVCGMQNVLQLQGKLVHRPHLAPCFSFEGLAIKLYFHL